MRLEKWLSLCQTEPVLTGFETDPPLVKVEPISGADCISVMTCLRKDKKHYRAAVRQDCCPTDTKTVRKEGEEVLQASEEIPWHLWRRAWRQKLSPCSL